MARPTWKGYLGFGLVQLPVQLHRATQEDDIDMRMLDRRDLSPVGYQRVNKATGEEVPWSEIVRGVEVSPGKYVVIGAEDLKKAHPKATKTIEITDFVDASEISAMRWSNAYFVAPDPRASPKAYVVLREALRQSGKVGVAKVVMRTRQHLCAVAALGNAIVLANLRFDDELRDPDALDELASVEDVTATKKEVDLAIQLVETLSGPFQSSKYRDDYQDALRDYIEKKLEEGEVGEAPEAAEEAAPAATGAADLMAALRASLKKQEKPKQEKPKTARRSKRTPRRAATPRRGPTKKRAARGRKSA